MQRHVEPEILDELAVADPKALRSRKDLRRVNGWMGHGRIMAHELRLAARGLHPPRPARIIEIGAGDGHFSLTVGCRLCRDWPSVRATLLDKQDLVSPGTRLAFERLGWQAEPLITDVFDWLGQPTAQGWDVMVANLFLHHFSAAQLAELLHSAAQRTRVFLALEPRRSAWSLTFSRCLWIIGCNAVTRHDAPISVRAGLADRELSRLWPVAQGWSVLERPVGLFSHLFVAHQFQTS